MKTQARTQIVSASETDIPEILNFIRQLAIYEKLEHEVVATENHLRESLFGARPYAEVLLFEENSKRVGFALFFHSFSTFLGKPGIYLEDLFILPAYRGRGYGKKLLAHLARIALERGCGRLEWSVLDWNQPALDFYASLGALPMSEWTVQRMTGEELQKLALLRD